MVKQKINDDLKGALKLGNSFVVGVLRMIIASFKNKEIEKRGKGEITDLSEVEVIDILAREMKKRKDAADAYVGGGRNELAQKELQEIDVIKKYLPEQLSVSEIEKIVNKAIEAIGIQNKSDFGKIMGEAMKELKGKADSSEVSAIVKRKVEEKFK